MLSTLRCGSCVWWRGMQGWVVCWKKAGGTIYHSVSPLSSQSLSLFSCTPKSSDNNRQTVEPFLTSVFHTQSPADWGFENSPYSPWHSKLPASFLWQSKHTNTQRSTLQELAHTPAEVQINSWIDKDPTRWNAETIWLDTPSVCIHSSPSLPSLNQHHFCCCLCQAVVLRIDDFGNRIRDQWSG